MEYFTEFIDKDIYEVESTYDNRILPVEKHEESYWFYIGYAYVRATTVRCKPLNKQLIGATCKLKGTDYIGIISANESFGNYKHQYGVRWNNGGKNWWCPGYWHSRLDIQIIK